MSTGACRWAFSRSIGPTNRANYPRLSADGALERGDRVSPKAEQRVVDFGPERVSIFGVPSFFMQLHTVEIGCFRRGIQGGTAQPIEFMLASDP